jgi:hypothetical protein
MKLGIIVVGPLGLLALSSVASAQPPSERTGFQAGIRTGYSLPMGELRAGRELSSLASGQLPVIVDVGVKLVPSLFLGVYLGLGFGGVAGAAKNSCAVANAECEVAGFHLGIEAQYHFLPAGSVNPWLGYGLGYESSSAARRVAGTTTTMTLSGVEFARLMAGVDFRLTRVLGAGPFVDLSMASYNTYTNGSTAMDFSDTSTHQWLTLGARFVFFP